MMWSILLVVWFCEVQGGPVDSQNGSDFQKDEGQINSLKSVPPHLTRPSETVLDFDDDYTIQEGDLLLPTDRNAVKQLWVEVNGRISVPYVIDSVIEDRTEDILKAIKMISEKTCIHFHEHGSETDFLHFQYSSGCASYVGCMGGEQPVLVGPHCKPGNICHEILHSLGLFHEHSRADRGDHITILFDNVQSGKRGNFEVKHGNTLGLDYDPSSIMHYGDKYFSSNGKPTIVPKDGEIKIGQRTYLSDLDVQKLRKMYHCDKENEQETSDASNSV